MAITSISVIMTVIVLNFHYRGPVKKELPKWIKDFLHNNLIIKNEASSQSVRTLML